MSINLSSCKRISLQQFKVVLQDPFDQDSNVNLIHNILHSSKIYEKSQIKIFNFAPSSCNNVVLDSHL